MKHTRGLPVDRAYREKLNEYLPHVSFPPAGNDKMGKWTDNSLFVRWIDTKQERHDATIRTSIVVDEDNFLALYTGWDFNRRRAGARWSFFVLEDGIPQRVRWGELSETHQSLVLSQQEKLRGVTYAPTQPFYQIGKKHEQTFCCFVVTVDGRPTYYFPRDNEDGAWEYARWCWYSSRRMENVTVSYQTWRGYYHAEIGGKRVSVPPHTYGVRETTIIFPHGQLVSHTVLGTVKK